jgi:hypothetical protein
VNDLGAIATFEFPKNSQLESLRFQFDFRLSLDHAANLCRKRWQSTPRLAAKCGLIRRGGEEGPVFASAQTPQLIAPFF